MGKGGDQLMPVFWSRQELERFGAEMEKLRVEIFMRDYLAKVRPFPKVRELFERIRADGLQIALASSAKEEELKAHKKNLKVDDLFETQTSADDAAHSKPCPDIFQAALAGLKDVAATEAIVIGDTPYDSQAASKAGMKAIGVLSGGFSEARLREESFIRIYCNVADILDHYDDSPLAIK
jgi:HAD superfamily hydrolase (TIGR01509 family)